MTKTVHALSRDLSAVSVTEAMTRGVVTCPVDTPLADVAKLMADRRIHCVIASDAEEPAGPPWGVVSDLDLAAAVAAGEVEDETAGRAAATPALTVAADETLQRAAQLLTEHAVAHLVVVALEGGGPVGVLSTLDVARAVATLALHDETPTERSTRCASST